MNRLGLTLTLAIALVFGVNADGVGQTLTTWDCCKPACAWSSSLQKNSNAQGYVKVCGKDDNPLSRSQGQNEQSSCTRRSRGNGYLCSSYSPVPVSEDLSYGFAVTKGTENCCKCFELQWTDGPARDKRMQVQVINSGGSTDNGRDFVILTPGGGVGPNKRGCRHQFGGAWGDDYGGVKNRQDCESLPSNLQGGCYWRFNWARGDVNSWPIQYKQISCPDNLVDISGCNSS